MALLTFEGFEAYGTGTESGQALNTSQSSASIVTTQARTGSRSLQAAGWWRRTFTMSGSTIVAGIGWRIAAFGTINFLQFRGTAGGTSELGFGINSSGNLRVARGSSFGTIIATNSVETEPQNTWVYYELKVLLDHTANGSYTLRRNGQVVMTGSNVITLSGAGVVVNQVSIETSTSIGSNSFCDDLYVCDGSGSANNDFLGQVRVTALRPESNLSVGWTPNTGANWDAVNDTTPDDDTTYVSASTTGVEDLYGMTDLPTGAVTVRGVLVQYRARFDNPGAAETRSLLRSGSTTVQGGLDALDIGYRYYSTLWETNPDTSSAWTPSAVNAIKAGVRRET